MWGMDSARNCAAHGHSPLVSIKLSQAAATTILRSAGALLPEQAQNHETTKSTLRLWISQAQTLGFQGGKAGTLRLRGASRTAALQKNNGHQSIDRDLEGAGHPSPSREIARP